MGALLSYPIVLIVGGIGFVAGLGRTLVLVGAALMVGAALSMPGHISKVLQDLPVNLSPQAVSMTSTALAFIGVPVLASLLLRTVYDTLRLPWFLDRVLGAALGVVAGVAVKQWLTGGPVPGI